MSSPRSPTHRLLVAPAAGSTSSSPRRAPLTIPAERVFPLSSSAEEAARPVLPMRARPLSLASRSTTKPYATSYVASTGCRWPSSSQQPRMPVMSVEDIDGGSTTGSRCCIAGTGAPRTDAGPWSRSSTGRGTCSRETSAERSDGSRSSTAAPRWPAPTSCSRSGALDEVHSLVDQSLLTVVDVDGPVRYRMLEPCAVGRMQLVGRGKQRNRGRAAGLGTVLCRRRRRRPRRPGQVEAVRPRARGGEQSRPTACARRLALPDPGHDRAPDRGARRLLDDQGGQRARHRRSQPRSRTASPWMGPCTGGHFDAAVTAAALERDEPRGRPDHGRAGMSRVPGHLRSQRRARRGCAAWSRCSASRTRPTQRAASSGST